MKKLITSTLFLALIILLACSDDMTVEPPTIETTVSISPFSATINEGIEVGTLIGTVTGSTNQGDISYSLSDINPSGSIAINANSGSITVADAAAFDFDINQQITATVTASNDGKTDEATVTITINEIDMTAPRIIWTGPTVTFSKAAGADPGDEANQDRISDNVWITRGNNGGQIYNIKTESAYDKDASPADTEWAIGKIEDIDNLTFQSFRDALGGKPKNEVGTDLVMHLITDDIYLSLRITNWEEKKEGGFTYERSSM